MRSAIVEVTFWDLKGSQNNCKALPSAVQASRLTNNAAQHPVGKVKQVDVSITCQIANVTKLGYVDVATDLAGASVCAYFFSA